MIIIYWALLFAITTFSTSSYAEDALSHINKTQTLRCGYVEYSPALTKDMKTGVWSGFNADIMKEIGQRLDVNIDFASPTGWATVVADLNTKKFDMLCSGFWVHPNVGKFALFSRPFIFQPVFIVARANDTRFDHHIDLNSPNLKMVALEGDNPVNIAKADFPQAKVLELPNMTDFSQVLVNVADGRADFTIVDAYTFGAYNKNNPGKLKLINTQHPVRVYPVSYVFQSTDVIFRDAVNAALDEMILDGTMDKIFNKIDIYPHAFYRATISYKDPASTP